MELGRRFQGAGIAFYIDVENERERKLAKIFKRSENLGGRAEERALKPEKPLDAGTASGEKSGKGVISG